MTTPPPQHFIRRYTDFGALLIIERVATLVSTLAAMLLRPNEYRSDAHHDDAHAGDHTLVTSASATA